MTKKIWYAYQETEDEREEGCWDGNGTDSRSEAENWLRDQYNSGNVDAQVAVLDCDDDWTANLCIEVITTDDI